MSLGEKCLFRCSKCMDPVSLRFPASLVFAQQQLYLACSLEHQFNDSIPSYVCNCPCPATTIRATVPGDLEEGSSTLLVFALGAKMKFHSVVLWPGRQ
jgi:hypothetical protein